MFDIMKDLKKNIQKNNMKNLVLSAVLGVFCYCINNAMEHKKEGAELEDINIIDVLGNMILKQVEIFNAKEAIKEKGGKIYITIKDLNEKVTKGNLLNFIKNHFNAANEKAFKEGIDYLEQYFHLEKINEDEECKKDNLTEIFWEEKEGGEVIDGVENDITDYLVKIAEFESLIHQCFKRYYNVKKAKNTKKEEEKKKEEIIEEITNECCKGDKEGDPHTNFLAILGNLCEKEQLKEQLKDKKDAILTAIQRRITLTENITKDALRDFIKQKIEPLDEKNNDPIIGNGDKPKGEKGGCCSCCDCWENKKNQEVEVEESQYELE